MKKKRIITECQCPCCGKIIQHLWIRKPAIVDMSRITPTSRSVRFHSRKGKSIWIEKKDEPRKKKKEI